MRPRIAVIGMGHLGSFHAEKLLKSPAAELVAVVDTDEAKLAQWQQVVNVAGAPIRCLNQIDELQALGIDCACVATPTSAHYAGVSWLVDHNIDVLVEKPLALSYREARELVSRAADKGRILQVGHVERFNPALQALKSRLASPRFFEIRRLAPFTGRGLDIDVVLDLMIHDLDLVLHLLEQKVDKVDAVGVPVLTNVWDIASARLSFSKGAVANITASRVSFKSERTFRIFQPDAYMVVDFGKKTLSISERKLPGTPGAISLGAGLPQISFREESIENRDALGDEIGSFITCVTKRLKPEVTGEDGLRAIQLAEQVCASMEENLNKVEANSDTACLDDTDLLVAHS